MFIAPIESIRAEAWQNYNYTIMLDIAAIGIGVGFGILMLILMELCGVIVGFLFRPKRSKKTT